MQRILTVSLCVLMCAVGLSAQKKQLTIESIGQSVSVNDPEFSPDSQKILFVSNKSGQSKMWMMGANGSNPRLVLNDEEREGSPNWSPDGKWIAFSRAGDIWVVDAEGKNLRRVTNDRENERAFVWSPDGKRIAFISDRAKSQEAYKEKNQDIYVVEVGTGKVEQLTKETNAWDETRWRPEWSPDGKWIAYVSNRSDYFADDLWLVEVATKQSRKVTTDVRVMSSPIWSPDGKRIALNGVWNHQFWYGDQSDIFIVDVPALTVRKLEMNTYVSDGNGSGRMVWSPDSQFLYFRYLWQGNSNIWSVPATGGVATQVTYEVGSARNFSLSPDGKFIAQARSTPTSGGELYLHSTLGGGAVQLTNWFEEFEGVTAPTRIAYRSVDGHYMQGYLYLPPNFDNTKKYPCLVQAHGGGTNSYGNGFHAMEQFLAQQGFVVLAIEYRGGSGFGREFQELGLGEWSSGQGWDAVGAAQYLKSLPYSNGKVGMYGGSYGAIMTMAAVTRDSTPFDAAAPFYGRYDWEDAFPFGDRIAKFWTIQGHLGFKPGENPEIYEHTATLRHIKKIKPSLPFLITHGERDRRTPYQQAPQLVETLKRNGNFVEFYSYPEEGHGFRLRKNRLHAYGKLLEFLNQYLR